MLGFVTTVSNWAFSRVAVCRKVVVISKVVERLPQPQPLERSLLPRQEILENHQMINKGNNGANTGNPSNQSHARDNVEHTSQNHAIGAGVRRTCSNASAVGGKVRLRIVPVRVQGKQPGQVVETYALLNNGSDVSLCDEKLIDELGISGVQRHFFLTTQAKDSARTGYEVKLIINSIVFFFHHQLD